MATLIIALVALMVVALAIGIAQWADGADAIDREEAKKVKREKTRLIFPSGNFRILDEVEADYSHIRI